MDVLSVCPLRVASILWQPPRGGWVLTAVCKATYRLSPAESALAPEQEHPNAEENHWNDDPARSLYAPSDLAPFKPRAEITLVGHAFAPRDERRASFYTRLAAGTVDKSIEVFGDRAFSQAGALNQQPCPAKVPLRYERAAGGPETSNPVGVRLGVTDAFGTMALPNLQPPGIQISRPGDFIEPVGFGPIAASWPARQMKLGRLQGQWSEQLLTSLPMPEDIDPSYFMAAPADQQLEALRSNERILLENLHPEHPRLVTSLPGVEPRAFVERPGSAPRELSMTCDTLWIDTDRGICALTWRAQIPLSRPQEAGRVVIAKGEIGQRLAWAEVEMLLRSRAAGAPAVSEAREAREVPQSAAVATPERRRLRGTQEPPMQDIPLAALPFQRPAAESGAIGVPASARPSYPPAPPASAGAVPAPPPLVRPAPVSGPSAPASAASPWASGGPRPLDVTPAEPLRSPLSQPLSGSPPAAAPSASAPAAPAAAPPLSGLSSSAPPPSSPAPPASSPAWSTPPSSRAVAQGRPAALSGSGEGAAARSAAAASNAAAAAAAAAAATSSAAAPELSSQRASIAALGQPSPRTSSREPIELIWRDPAAASRVRAAKAFREALALKTEPGAWTKGADDGPREAQEARDRRDVLRALTRGRALDAAGLSQAIDGALDDDGVFEPPTVLTSGELSFTFDEIEALKATITVVSPFIGTDKKLRDTVTAATELLKSEWRAMSDVAEGFTDRIKEAFAQASRALAPNYLQTSVDKLLLEGRHYQRKVLLGENRIRALLDVPGGGAPVPAYLPEAQAKQVPLFKQFKAKVLAELHLRQDAQEACPEALFLIALGRAVRDGRP
jgi:hypothetical protein